MQPDNTAEQILPPKVEKEANLKPADNTNADFARESKGFMMGAGNLQHELVRLVSDNPQVDLNGEKGEMDALMEEATRLVDEGSTDRIQTLDGQRVFLFRYENPQSENKNPNSSVSKDELVGNWFTDSPKSLKIYIKRRQPGGSIRVLELPKDQLEKFKAINHPVAKDMDMEPIDNFIIPDELLPDSRSIPLEVQTKVPQKFLMGEWKNINEAVDDLTSGLQIVEQNRSDFSVDEQSKLGDEKHPSMGFTKPETPDSTKPPTEIEETPEEKKARLDGLWSAWEEIQKDQELVALFDRKADWKSDRDPKQILNENGYPERTKISELQFEDWTVNLNPKFVKDGFVYLLRGDHPDLEKKGFYTRPYGYGKHTMGNLTQELQSSDDVGYFLTMDERFLKMKPKSNSIAQQLAYQQSAMGGSSFISTTTNLDTAIAGTGNQPAKEEQRNYEVYIIKVPQEYVINSNTGNHFGMNENECLVPDYISPDEIIAKFPRDNREAVYKYLNALIGVTKEDLGMETDVTSPPATPTTSQ